MCGIAGFLSRLPARTAENCEAIASAMADRLAHRGPDDSGAWADAEVGIALGHRRLAILDLSPAGHQPMISHCGRYVIAFNGEIYNHAELRANLDRGGAHAWRGHSDTETLLALIAMQGVTHALQSAVGMFALAVWDRKARLLTLARDRMGEKPLYYGWQNGAFVFGSELKALKAHPDFQGEPSRESLSLLMRYSYIPAPYSIYEGIFKLRPGCLITVSADGRREATEEAYWSLARVAIEGERNPFRGADNEATGALEAELVRSIKGQSLADVPVGALLSGGIDSSTIVALMQAHSTRPVRTFTIGFSEQQHDEAPHAAAVAKHLGTDHTQLILSPQDTLNLIPDLPCVYDEPFADSSQLPTQLVMRLARQKVTVALSGDGGDELFGGYNRYRFVPAVWQKMGWIPSPIRKSLGRSMLSLSTDQWDRLLRPIGSTLRIAQAGEKVHKLGHRIKSIANADDLFFSVVSNWEQPADVVVGAVEPVSLLSDRDGWPTIRDPVARMMALDALSFLPDDVLTKVDRASMAVSPETRAPFLDHRVVEFAFGLPMELKLRAGTGKWLLRQVLERYVPRAMFERPKMGFGVPLDAWLRGPLRPWAEGLLEPSTLRNQGYFDPQSVQRVWKAHLNGASNSSRLWSVLMFQAWLEQFRGDSVRTAPIAA